VSAIEGLLNYSCEIYGRTTDVDDPLTNDEENHPAEIARPLLATVPCAVQERSMREQLSLVNVGKVQSTHKIYMVPPTDVVVDESRTLHVVELERDISIVGVRDGGGWGHHLEIDGLEFDSGQDVQAGS
jgi:hypothetical protein